MNRILPPRRTRVASKRIAAATAAVVGAALLTYSGGAAAQTTGADCAALGDRPSANGLEAALERADACGVEVRITDFSGPYEAYLATPDARVHLVQTVDPVHDDRDRGPADPTLVESDGTLAQANSPISFTFSGTDTDAPLMRTTGAVFDWAGAKPVPALAANTAMYEGLTEGLDLEVETGISRTRLAFTADGHEAWQALSTGLTFTGATAIGTLYAKHTDNLGWDHWAPMTVRDVNGAVGAVQSTVSSGALTLTVDQAFLDEAAFPLTLTTQATIHRTTVNEWGAVTSASPTLGLFRGDTGLDQSYFAAAGQGADAVAGRYCDALVDAECATEYEAAVYWNFWGPGRRSALDQTTPGSLTKTAQHFSVAAADPDVCTAPVLHTSDVYRPSTTWENRPAADDLPAAGECRAGTAVYDLTDVGHSVALSMQAGEGTARFDGGSARLDTYYAIMNNFTLTGPACAAPATAPKYQTTSSVTYGNFTADIWRGDLVDPALTWAATIVDSGTGETVFSTDPVAVEDGTHPPATVALPDGAYRVEHRFTSAASGYTSTAGCDIVIDTALPDLISIDVEDGTHYVWDTVDVTVEVSDEGFPDGVNSVKIWCGGNCSPTSKTLTSATTVTFAVRLEQRLTTLSFSATDKAGNRTAESVQILATEPSNDYNGDGHQDLLTVRKVDGTLMLHPGKGDGAFGAATAVSSGWSAMDVVMAGDLTGDRLPDVLARDTKTGYLYTYPGDGKGGLRARFQSGAGWNGMSDFTSALDYDGNGTIDLIALSERTSKLYFYPGDGKGKFGARSTISTGWVSEWATLDNLTTIGNIRNPGATPDLLAWDTTVGGYLVFFTDGSGGIEQVRHIEDDLTVDEADDGSRYSQVVGGGDYTGDDWTDIYAVDARTGSLVRRSYDQNLFEMTGSKTVATGWGGYRLPVADSERAYDYYSDGANEILARKASDGEVVGYGGNAVGGIEQVFLYSDDFKNADLIETAGDFTGDGHNDVLMRVASTGSLYVFPGDGQRIDYANRIRIGAGWNAMSAIVSGHDFNDDGKVDVIAREKTTGYLWLYPGKGNGSLGTRVKIGSGWNAMREITAAGDLDHDGHADIIAIRGSDNCMYFYGGRGDGTLKAGVEMSCNWVGYDQVAAVGDFDNDGHADWIARRKSDGALFLYRGNAAGGYGSRVQIGTGWNSMNIIA
jgi:hypothetical protein